MIEAALITLAFIPGWLILVALLGLGLLAPARAWLGMQGPFTKLAITWWLGFTWLSLGTMGLGILGQLNIPALALMNMPVILLGIWHSLTLEQRSLIWKEWLAVAAILAIACLSLPTALTPPTEGDTLAYHFALPQLYAAAGELLYAPVAVTFASPQFTHMVSTAALVLGGEPLLLASAWASSLMAAVAVLALARLWLPPLWAGAVAVLFVGAPVMTYAFSNGTVELRQAGLLAAAALAFTLYLRHRQLVPALLFAALLGGTVASKTFGLFLLPPAALLWLGANRTNLDALFWRHTLAVAFVGALVAAPWYLNAWWHYGSPVFPAAWELFGSPFWSHAQQAFIERVYFSTELMVPRNLGTLFSYPFTATFAGALMDSDRTGLGPFLPLGFLAAIVIVTQAIRARKIEPLAWLLLLAIGYYALWFFVGISGRSRHLLPVYPLLLVGVGVVFYAWWPQLNRLVRFGLIGAVVLVILAQSGMALLLNRTAALALLHNPPRAAYLETQAAHHGAAELANSKLGPTDKLLVTSLRNTLYYLRVPSFQNQTEYTQAVPLATGTPASVWQALQQQGFTAWLTQNINDTATDDVTGNASLRALVAAGCAELIAGRPGTFRASRTVAGFTAIPLTYGLYRLTPATCSLGAPMVQPTP